MPKPRIAVVLPTVSGREHSFLRAIDAYRNRSEGVRIDILAYHDRPGCGQAWQEGANEARGRYIHFSADDLEPEDGWWRDAVEACDQGMLPCPIVYNPDGAVQSAGGDLAAPNCLRTEIAEDWAPMPFSPVPFVSREQWEDIGPMPPGLHYFTDVFVSEKGRRAGFETVLRHGYRFTHWNEKAGRGAGMNQGSRAHHDREIYHRYMAEMAAA